MEKIYSAKTLLFYKVPDFPTKGVTFIDMTPTCRIPIGMYRTTIMLAGLVGTVIEERPNGQLDFDYVICPDARGFLWGMSVSLNAAIPLVPVRKPGKLPPECVMDSIEYKTEYSTTKLELPYIELIEGKKFLFVDDVFATGGTYEACKQLVERNGGIMLDPFVLLDLKLNNKYNVHSLITIDDVNNAKEFDLSKVLGKEDKAKYELLLKDDTKKHM